MDYYNENPINHLDDTEYIEKIDNKVNNNVDLYTAYDDIYFNWLM